VTNLITLVISALIAIESGGRADAVGDGGLAVGILQMWPIAVREAVRLEAIEARREGRQARTWTEADRLDPQASREMAEVTLRHHYRRGVTDPVQLAGRWRNPNGDAPEWYLRKARKELGKKG